MRFREELGVPRENPSDLCNVRRVSYTREFKQGRHDGGEMSDIKTPRDFSRWQSPNAGSAMQSSIQVTLLVVRPFASHQGEPGSIPGRVTPGFSQVGIVQFSRGYPALAFWRCSVLTSLSPSSALKASLVPSKSLDSTHRDTIVQVKAVYVARS
ncbi:hypothetical protein PR048_030049 [Dryococelus australis]|uniref:Uncharacterized protein n=1 Tax=Dryococelus australis TaxID=614101 RepID=A0ABQ9G7V5_9NEOP|nr:hypothetical protein PR048_030049 [Dryococelus australis]